MQDNSDLKLFEPTTQTNIKLISDLEHEGNYTKLELKDTIILGNALDVLAKLPSALFDMIFIDPPYYLQLSNKSLKRWNVKTTVEGVNDEWDNFKSFKEYDTFITKVLTEVKHLMKPQATIWVIGTYHNIFRIGKIMQDLGYWILNDVIWVKTNPMPNWLGVRFTNATETLIWAVKSKDTKHYTFNREYAKLFAIGKIAGNVWVLPICSGKERLRDDNGNKIHSTQKPIELIKRVILTSTKEGDLILDPMAGVGTTGYVAYLLKRHFVMIEINPKYVEWTIKRFNSLIPIKEVPKQDPSKIAEYLKIDNSI